MLGTNFWSTDMSCVVLLDLRDGEQPLLGCKDTASAGIVLGFSLQGSSTPDFLLHLQFFRQHLTGKFSLLYLSLQKQQPKEALHSPFLKVSNTQMDKALSNPT